MTLASLVHPQVAALAAAERRAALREARREPFDVLELVGMAAGLILAALVRRHLLPPLGTDCAPCVAEHALACAALLAAALGPFLVRRTRRGLRAVLGTRA